MVQNPAMQWMMELSIYLTGNHVPSLRNLSSLAGYVLAKNALWSTHPCSSFIAAMALPKQVVLYHWYVMLTSWEFTILFGQLSAFDWMAIWVFLMKQFSEKHPYRIA